MFSFGTIKYRPKTDWCRHILSLGAIAITLSVLMEPALQALITTVGSLRPEAYDASSASISSNSYLDGGFESVVEHSSE